MIELVIWKDVEGFEGLYRVSNEGVLISTPRRGTKGGMVKRHKGKNGHEVYNLFKDGKSHTAPAYRLLAKHFVPNPDNKPNVNHIDGNPMNNSLDNLEWVTQSESVERAVKNERFTNKGETHTNATLNDKEVLEIRDLYNQKIYNQIELGEIYKTSQATISYIVRNKVRKVVES